MAFKLILLMAAAVAAASPATVHATTFDGRCSLVGSAHYTGGGLVPVAMTWTAEANGVCTGRVDGRSVLAAHARVELTVRDRAAGCASIDADADATLQFLDRAGRRTRDRLDFTIPDWRSVAFVARGRRGGQALGVFSAYLEAPEFEQDPTQCLDGRVTDYPFGLRLMTLTPLSG